MGSKHRYKVAIGLPVYQGERYLAEAVESILRQTEGDFELIISDNASTDATEQVARAYASRDRRVRYVRNEQNFGVAENFNRAFRVSRSTYFRWAAYDDTLEPTYLQRCVERLDADPSLATCHSLTRRIDQHGRVLGTLAEQTLSQSHRPSDRFGALVRGKEYTIWSVMRSDYIRRTQLHGRYTSSDLTFLAEMCLMGRFGFVHEYLFNLREHPAAYTSSARSPEEQARWWGQRRMMCAQYLQAPLSFCAQADVVRRSRLPWDQKVVCWRHLSLGAGNFARSVGRRWWRRAVNGWNGNGFVPHAPEEIQTTGEERHAFSN
ncbi:MAG: glycosyltransferase family 2 protein [Tepidisphaeraceae bacterium]